MHCAVVVARGALGRKLVNLLRCEESLLSVEREHVTRFEQKGPHVAEAFEPISKRFMFPVADRAGAGRGTDFDDRSFRAPQASLIGYRQGAAVFCARKVCALTGLVDDESTPMQMLLHAKVQEPDETSRSIVARSEIGR